MRLMRISMFCAGLALMLAAPLLLATPLQASDVSEEIAGDRPPPPPRVFGDTYVQGGQTRPISPEDAALQFESTTVDFGTVDEGEDVIIKFQVTNTKNFPVKIERLHTGCGCTEGKDNPEEIAAGETATLQVVYKTKGRRGNAARTMALYTNDPAMPEYRLGFTGKVRSKLYWGDPYVSFEAVPAGESAERRVSLYSAFEDFAIRDLQIDGSDMITAELVEQKPFDAEGLSGTEYVYAIRMSEDMPITNFNARVTLTTNKDEYYLPPIQVRGTVVGEVEFQPKRLYIRAMVGEETVGSVALKSRTGKQFEVVEVVGEKNFPVEYEVKDGPSPTEKLLVGKASPAETDRTRQGKLTLRFKTKGSEKVTSVDLPVIMVVQRPTMVISPGSANAPKAPSSTGGQDAP